MKTRTGLLLILPAAVFLGVGVLLMQPGTPEGICAAQETDREIYLFTQGWKGEQIAAQEVIVPDGQDAVFADYAALQTAQGLPLSDYAGHSAVRYTYRLRDAPLYAELLTADGILIGAACYDPETHVLLPIQG